MIDREYICCKGYYSKGCDGVADRGMALLTSSDRFNMFLNVCNEND